MELLDGLTLKDKIAQRPLPLAEAIAIAIFQSPTANALSLSNSVREKMEKLKANFPPGMDYDIVYDPTRFVQTSIEKVVVTLDATRPRAWSVRIIPASPRP